MICRPASVVASLKLHEAPSDSSTSRRGDKDRKIYSWRQVLMERTFEDENKTLKQDIAAERAELEAILNNRQVNTLLDQLKEERTQRLVEMEASHVREREMQALSSEAAVATKGALLAHEEAAGKRAEVNGLRASIRVSTKLLHVRPPYVQTNANPMHASRLPSTISTLPTPNWKPHNCNCSTRDGRAASIDSVVQCLE
ncbi:hypothetical protein DYB28_000079 [Aphanomyces astaci]|uniref:Uncharacterized protein n=1 Tax=Aphanomyces astaci TaxID=112090 RepID=A0A9X8E2Q6_APHAT|nr:hypothetical protein DYB28_000079 [Aphanomyces astaci]